MNLNLCGEYKNEREARQSNCAPRVLSNFILIKNTLQGYYFCLLKHRIVVYFNVCADSRKIYEIALYEKTGQKEYNL